MASGLSVVLVHPTAPSKKKKKKKKTKKWKLTRGCELPHSAVLAAELHAKVSSQELAESTVIELDSYELSSAPKLHGPGSIFYLAISAYHLPTHPRPSPLPREVESSLSPYALASLRDGQVLKPIRRPLDLLSLSALGLAHPAQNRLCDVVGIVAALAPRVVRAPIGVKREVFLVDPWAAKQWTLSVWVRPELCSVARGTVVLLRNVRNHRFGGGSLNAYRDDCEGWDWMLLNPVHVVGCRVEEMRRWWVGREGGEAG
ncbi:MAG: hypothetical protein M1829_002981 [Trizodia sp. TS-e1964]|nr:MAG: hypothetical protein M1829_002981 [Trizodia sp. TS-e1964]